MSTFFNAFKLLCVALFNVFFLVFMFYSCHYFTRSLCHSAIMLLCNSAIISLRQKDIIAIFQTVNIIQNVKNMARVSCGYQVLEHQ